MVEYHFSVFWLVVGIIVFLLGAFMNGFYKTIADKMGIVNYSRLRMWGLIFCGVGLLLIPNLLPWLIDSLFNWVISGLNLQFN